jgi:iduronate 2-sulfatase
MGYSLRTERHRYTEWEFGAEGEELYDYENDPRETHNLAGEPAAVALRSQLKEQLRGGIQRRGARIPA